MGPAPIARRHCRDPHPGLFRISNLFDWKSSAVQFFTLGLYAPKWQRAEYPKLPAAGRFEYEVFDPSRWVPDYPNAAFRNENPADRLWAARKILAFTDREIRAIVSTGQYSDPAAEDWVARCLIERRNKIARAYAIGMGALDGFEIREDRLEYRSLGAGRDSDPVVGVRQQQRAAAAANGRALVPTAAGGGRSVPRGRSQG